MKHIKKSFAVLLIVLCMALALSPAAFAVDSSVNYSGHNLFALNGAPQATASDLFPNFKNVMPGDVLTQTINISNTADCCDYIKVYLRAQVPEASRDFIRQLGLSVTNADKTVNASTAGLSENVLLCTLRSGESSVLTATLQVPVTLGNAFEYQRAEVSWVFTIEEYEDTPEEPEEPEEPIEVIEISDNDVPLSELGHGHGHCILHWLLLLAALVCLAAYAVDKNKREKKIEELKKRLGIS